MSELAQIIQEIQREMDAAPAAPEGFPETLPLTRIKTLPGAFQHREINEFHITELRRAIRNGGALEPVMILGAGQSLYLIDGHHRLEAYRREKWKEGVPILFFNGTAREAVAEAGRLNCRAKLSMTTQEKANLAWKLVNAGGFSKANIREASGVSDGTVASMRRVQKALGATASDHETWWDAQRAAKGNMRDWEQGDIDDWMEQQAAEWAERLHKGFGSKPVSNPELFAKALRRLFGEKTPELVKHLCDEELGDDEISDF
jgi:ParB-like chromosome segregation protein Spo0J